MDFDTFIGNAWHDHADHPGAVAARLASALDLIIDAAARSGAGP